MGFSSHMCENRSPEQEGITTPRRSAALAAAQARTAALNKKGLRRGADFARRRAHLEARTAALNKKGLRLWQAHDFTGAVRENRSPEQEGITTQHAVQPRLEVLREPQP